MREKREIDIKSHILCKLCLQSLKNQVPISAQTATSSRNHHVLISVWTVILIQNLKLRHYELELVHFILWTELWATSCEGLTCTTLLLLHLVLCCCEICTDPAVTSHLHTHMQETQTSVPEVSMKYFGVCLFWSCAMSL